ncbi:MAG: cytochrome c [Hydrogenovibrio crunogenus]|uniref:Cytochrome c-554(548) n=2 Tax=Hydrogenovibrio crunogenus TaxID=39765 RepID=A0A4P7NXZ5_9GAMM|nr:cytochrome c [Hydrogenovibrio crunogenus]MBD3611995.1 cytochrome c [Hydrogenovibrio crunogenus]QBZ82633.1 Cytochrome c-554(548) [Hydrogenovibrio crunogenus]RUM90406.1 MAG: cytochrome c [Thiomicrospira sp.]
MKQLFLMAFSVSFLFSNPAFSADMPAKAKTCVGCHGVDGNSMVPNFPKLAGQHAKYLEKALKDFRDGFRKDATMETFAKNLSDKEIKELAEYYASQEAK